MSCHISRRKTNRLWLAADVTQYKTTRNIRTAISLSYIDHDMQADIAPSASWLSPHTTHCDHYIITATNYALHVRHLMNMHTMPAPDND